MWGLGRFRMLAKIFVFFPVFCLLSGCVSSGPISKRSENSPLGTFNLSDLENNPCGTLHVRKPLFNVTGSLTADVRPNSSISLFVAPDTSLGSALYVVRNCAFILRKTIGPGKQFQFNYLPAADYVAMVPRSAFGGKIQGFPTVWEFNLSNYSMKFNFCGGDGKYSLVSFSIRPAPKDGENRKIVIPGPLSVSECETRSRGYSRRQSMGTGLSCSAIPVPKEQTGNLLIREFARVLCRVSGFKELARAY